MLWPQQYWESHWKVSLFGGLNLRSEACKIISISHWITSLGCCSLLIEVSFYSFKICCFAILYHIYDLKYSSYSLGFLFIFLVMSLETQKLFILMTSHLSIFFLLSTCAAGVMCKDCLIQRQIFTFLISCDSYGWSSFFQNSDFSNKVLYMVWRYSGFILFLCISSYPISKCWKKSFFLTKISWHPHHKHIGHRCKEIFLNSQF